MAQLSSVIGSILRDIISAQHEANLYSLSLSENYGKDGKIKDFQLPGVVISDMELELKYGVIRSDENLEQFNIKYNKFRQFIKALCSEAAAVTITSAVSSVLGSDIRNDDGGRIFFSRLEKEEELNRNFRNFLSRNMRNAFRSGLYDSVDHNTGEVIVDVTVSKLMDVVARKFLGDSELSSLFKGSDGTELKNNVVEDITNALTGLVKRCAEGKNFKRVKVFPQLDVAVTADELAKMPEDAIHTFKLKFSPIACSVIEQEDDDELEDFDMQIR